jgi:glycosyltransferase involved in cell wall biosynthesis
MTVLLNYRPVLHQPTGIGVYANAVLPALQELPHVLIPGGEEGTTKQRLKRLAWTQARLPGLAREYKASLIFTPAPEGYLGTQRVAQVVMVHDLRAISHPERSMQSLYFRAWVPPLLRSCQHVLTNSRFTAQEIKRRTGIPDSRITVTPLGYDDQAFTPGPPSTGFREQPYLLHLGQAYRHKNLGRVIKAFAEVHHSYPELKLVLAGKPHPNETPRLKRLSSELGVQHQIEFLPYVPYHELPDLYRGASALVYPSLWEGFGLPIIEAMACGTPVITSEGSATEEVAGGAALLVDPKSTAAISESLRLICRDKRVCDQLRHDGLKRVQRFSWHQTKTMTTRVLSSL